MPYEADPGTVSEPLVCRIYPAPNPRDLEFIATLMEFAVVICSTTAETIFTADKLFASVGDLAGEEVSVLRKDFDIVLRHAGFVRKVRGGYVLR
jgi:hypothetical protein